jgi:N-methylhydantoinase A
MTMDPDLARAAIEERFASPLGLSVDEAAEGIIRIANEHMAHGIRRMTIAKGLDPREFSLIAFGGAGPMHCVDIARELQMPDVIVPAHPGTTSALGLLAVDARHDLVRSFIRPLEGLDVAEVASLFSELEAEARQALVGEGYGEEHSELRREVDLRYVGQIRALTLPLGEQFDDTAAADLERRFHEVYEREFKYAVPELPVEIKALRMTAVGRTMRPQLATEASGGDAESAVVARELVHFDGERRETAFYDRARLAPGAHFDGPAIVEQYDSTTVVPPGMRGEVDPVGNLIVSTTTVGEPD